jgi:peptidyl-tRNA hydrolase, PTH1 family
MKLIVGLGNYGKEYDNTRHNMGFRYIDAFAKAHNTKIDKAKMDGLYTKINIDNEDVILLKPQKYMNLSGEVVREYVNYFKIDVKDILIISDDLDLPVGTMKLKYKGSSGGHNGLKNIEQNLGTSEYKRLKIGISNIKDMLTKDYVLGKIPSNDQKIYKDMEPKIINLLDDFITMDFEKLMSKYNI